MIPLHDKKYDILVGLCDYFESEAQQQDLHDFVFEKIRQASETFLIGVS